MRFRGELAKRQAQSGGKLAALQVRFDLSEFIEDALLVFNGNAGAVVANAEQHSAGVGSTPIGLDANCDRAVARLELDGVADEVDENAAE